MIKVMHICSDSIVGGASVTLLRLIKHADKDNFEHYVLIPASSPFLSAFQSTGVNVIPLKSGSDSSKSLRCFFECFRFIREISPDIVHTHGAFFGRFSAFLCGVKSRIYTRHTFNEVKYNIILRFLNRIITTRAVAVNDVLYPQLINSGIDPDEILLIENGCEKINAYSKEKTQNTVLLYIGRIVREKGLDTAIEGIKILSESDKKYQLLIVGDGDYRSELEKNIIEYGMTEYVKLLPFRCDVTDVISDCDILVNCSPKNEATSISVMEAMSAFKPCVVSDAGGNTNVVTDGYDGAVFKSGDPHDFACAVRRLSAGYDDCSKNAYKTYNLRFRVEYMTKKYESLWKDEYDRIQKG